MKEVVYVNGSLVPAQEAKISIFDHGFLYGDGLFETMRAYSGKVFRIEQHLKRLFNSLKLISLDISLSKFQLTEAVYQTLAANRLGDAYIRLTISRGPGPTGLDPRDCSSPGIVIIAKRLTPYTPQTYKMGFRTIVTSIRSNNLSVTSRIKSMNYLPNILARIEAARAGVDEGILLNTEENVAEGAVSNIFLIYQDVILTPSRESGILPGITRKTVIKLARQLRYKVYEKGITLPGLIGADEAFLTNSLMEIMPLVEIDKCPIGDGKPGRITRILHQAYKKLVKKETRSS